MEWTKFPRIEMAVKGPGRIIALPLSKDGGLAKKMIGTAPIGPDFFKKKKSRILERDKKLVIVTGTESEKDGVLFGTNSWKMIEKTMGPVKFHLVPDFLPEDKVLEGALLASYKFGKYRTKQEERPWIVFHGKKKTIKDIAELARGVFIARDITNEPANELYPEKFAEIVRETFEGTNVEVEIYSHDWLKQNQFGGIISVGKGSENKPRLVVMKYRPTGKKPVLLVGKGVSFDSGGIHIKPTGYIEEMKMDIAGGAAAVGVMWAIQALKIKQDIIAIVPCVENMPSGRAAKPGDVVRMYNGKTVEIDNTDAEGRVIMADALAYGIERFEPKYTIDIATLTGTCITALGSRVAGIMGTDQKLIDELIKAGEVSGELVWQLPLFDHYKRLLKSELADIANNSSKREAGTIKGAVFLNEFVKGSWAHIDIAGPGMASETWNEMPKGGTGFGVRLILRWLQMKK
ncbi:MAG: leucyl aminopeptidase [Candidatus Altiarchaeota archaeon]|nr:leucyl aminopeptidase [Candidatus Altiarchaeota archaeon]